MRTLKGIDDRDIPHEAALLVLIANGAQSNYNTN